MISNTLQRRLMAVETEQELVVTELHKEIAKLRQEKAQLTLEMEQEEELLVNTLTKKLEAEQREKGALEKRLQAEAAQVSQSVNQPAS